MLNELTPRVLSLLSARILRAKRSFLGSRQGGHLSPKKGHGIEFSDFRPYEPGDNPRDIDWGVYARTDRLFIKRFQEEEDLSVLIFVDQSKSMESKWDDAWTLALGLSFVALASQDTVIIEQKFVGPKSFARLKKTVPEKPSGRSFVEGIRLALSKIRFPGIMIVISDFLMPLEEIESGINLCRAKNLELIAIRVLSEEDKKPELLLGATELIDSESGRSLPVAVNKTVIENFYNEFKEHQKGLAEFFRYSRVKYFEVKGKPVPFLLETGILG